MSDFPDEVLQVFLNAFRPFPKGVLPATLAERVGVSVDDLSGLRARAERDGFVFESDDDGRWILTDMPDTLAPYWVKAGLRCDRLGHQVFFSEEVETTQDIAFELMAEGRTHGTLVLAEHQTAGRGRGDRTWVTTPKKSLVFSLLLDLEPPETFASVLTVATATALARAVQEIADLPARIKFPNDVMVRDKKVAGILLEVRDYGGELRRAVVGVGINVNQAPEDFPEELREIATSLKAERRDGTPLRRARLLRRTLFELEHWLDEIAQGRFEELEEAWQRFGGMQGRDAEFVTGGERLRGRVLEATLRSGFKFRMENGEQREVRLEHVSELNLL